MRPLEGNAPNDEHTEEFDRLHEAFEEATQFYSGFDYHTEDAIKAEADLMALGPEIVLPNALRVLQTKPIPHLMVLLARLTEANPVKLENRGRVRKMADDWIEWGRLRGIRIDGEREVTTELEDNVRVATDIWPPTRTFGWP